MASNYDIMAAQARKLFLTFDQEEIIRRWDLRADESFLYLELLGEPVLVDRRTGEGGSYQQTLILFDLLTKSAVRPYRAGRWSSLSELGGVIGARHEESLKNAALPAAFAGKCGQLEEACLALNGRKYDKGDASFIIPVFQDFEMLIVFWDADDEFPASVRFLFDANALLYMRYETLWYVIGYVSDKILSYVKSAFVEGT